MNYVSKNQGKPKRIVMWFPCFEVVWLYHIGRILVVLAEVESHPCWKDQPQLLGHNCHPGWLATAIPHIIFLGLQYRPKIPNIWNTFNSSPDRGTINNWSQLNSKWYKTFSNINQVQSTMPWWFYIHKPSFRNHSPTIFSHGFPHSSTPPPLEASPQPGSRPRIAPPSRWCAPPSRPPIDIWFTSINYDDSWPIINHLLCEPILESILSVFGQSFERWSLWGIWELVFCGTLWYAASRSARKASEAWRTANPSLATAARTMSRFACGSAMSPCCLALCSPHKRCEWIFIPAVLVFQIGSDSDPHVWWLPTYQVQNHPKCTIQNVVFLPPFLG